MYIDNCQEGHGRKARTMTSKQAAECIFDNLDEFEAKYADVIAKFESKGIEHSMAKALAITTAAYAKAASDLMATL